MNGPTDEQLYTRFRKGEAAAFDDLYQRYRKPLYLFLLRSVSRPADADDLFQELWTRVIQRPGSFKDGSLKAWLFRIARNLCIDLYRRHNLRPIDDSPAIELEPAGEPPLERQVDATDCEQRLLTEIAALPAEQREAFLLKEETGLPLERIGDLAGVGRETVKSRLRYAMKQLRQALEDCL